MTGRQLYDQYSYQMAQIKIPVEDWDELIESEQQVWEHLASKLRGTS